MMFWRGAGTRNVFILRAYFVTQIRLIPISQKKSSFKKFFGAASQFRHENTYRNIYVVKFSRSRLKTLDVTVNFMEQREARSGATRH